ncbi:LPXTG cell wall anchor domain-containing protein [Arthrobacter methylotrophus]|uniref:LPXTG cell wall anchor domain-containing protein n=1 Tax=Arthrobacter methylotrophus TaxID=121291 RepID=A0ABV5ULC7_9MICC
MPTLGILAAASAAATPTPATALTNGNDLTIVDAPPDVTLKLQTFTTKLLIAFLKGDIHMYGNSGVPPAAGGIVGGTLAYTGVNTTAAILVAGFCLLTGILLLVRSRHFKKTADQIL